MYKRIIYLFLLEWMFLLVVLSFSVKASDLVLNAQKTGLFAIESSVTFSTESKCLNLEDPTKVTASLHAESNVSSYQIKLKYDSDVFEVISITVNSDLVGTISSNIDVQGEIIVAYSQISNISNHQNLFEIEMNVIDDTRLGDTLSFELDYDYDNKFYTIQNNQMNELTNIVYDFGFLHVGIIGDVNLDGVVDIADAIMIQLYLVNKVTLSAKQQKIADVNYDGVLDIADVNIIQLFLAQVINSLENFVEPTSISLTGSKTEILRGSSIKLNHTVTPSSASQAVTYSTSNPNIATVSYNGTVTGINYGSATITVSVVKNPLITATYNVNIMPHNLTDPTSIIITSNDTKVKQDNTINLNASVYPALASQNVIWSSMNEAIATVNENGTVLGLYPGVVSIKAQSSVDPRVYEHFVLTIEPIGEQLIPNMLGYEINIMTAPHVQHEHNPFHEFYPYSDKEAKKAAWLDIETIFNCKFKVVPYPAQAPWGVARIAWLASKANLNQAETDIFVTSTDWVKDLGDNNAAVDTSLYYQIYGSDMVNNVIKNASTYQGKLLALPTSSYAQLYVDKGIFYNVELVESLGLESPAKIFNEGRWTYEGFTNYVKNAANALSANQAVLSGEPSAYYIGMVNASGISLADYIEIDMNFDHPYAIETANILRDLYLTEKGWGSVGLDSAGPSFSIGNAIFIASEYWYLNTTGRFPSTLWDPAGNSRFGFVPFPYPNEMTKEDTKTVGVGGACYMMANGRSWNYNNGVTEGLVYNAFASMMRMTELNMSDNPELDEELLMKADARTKLGEEASVTALVFFKKDKIIFDPLYGLFNVQTYIGPAINQIVCDGEDYTTVIDTIESIYYQKLLDIYGN